MRVEINCDLSVKELDEIIQNISEVKHAEDDQPEENIFKEYSGALYRAMGVLDAIRTAIITKTTEDQ